MLGTVPETVAAVNPEFVPAGFAGMFGIFKEFVILAGKAVPYYPWPHVCQGYQIHNAVGNLDAVFPTLILNLFYCDIAHVESSSSASIIFLFII